MNQQVFLIVAVAVISVIGFAIFMVVYKKKHPTAKDNRGRDHQAQKATGALRRFAHSNGYRFLGPVVLGETRLDALAIGVFGILGVKAYGYNGEIYGSAQDKEWLRVGYGDVRERFPNPVLEANRDVQALRSVLQKTRARNVPIEVVPVFVNPKAELAVGRGSGILTIKEFKSLLGRDKYQQEKGVDMQKAEEAISAANEAQTA